MFTSRGFAFLLVALAAACSALPADKPPAPLPRPVAGINSSDIDDTWFGFPNFSNFFAPLLQWFPIASNFGPTVHCDDKNFQVAIRVKDYNKDDLKVKVKNGFIIVRGTHESEPSDHNVFQSQFFHTYSMPANSSADDVKAELSSDKWLTVIAPITGNASKVNEGERIVEITETGTKYTPPKEEGKPASEVASNDDRREPTTPAGPGEREEVTEKDNIIPHGGNDVVPI